MHTNKSNQANKSKFVQRVEDILGYSLPSNRVEVSWITGGMTGGNCWGDEANRPIEADREPDFEELDKLLEVLCPKITYLQYKALVKNCVKLVSETENDYYGNYYYRRIKRVNLDDLAAYLKEKDLWEE